MGSGTIAPFSDQSVDQSVDQTTPPKGTPPTQEGKQLPTGEEEIRQLHHNIYETARQAYQSQFGMEIEYLEPRLDRTVYVSADPEIYFNPDAMPFYGDTQPKESIERVKISDESDSLMPGRTMGKWSSNKGAEAEASAPWCFYGNDPRPFHGG